MIDGKECNNILINGLITSYESIKDKNNKLIEDDDDIYEVIKYLFDKKIMHYYFKKKMK